MAKRHNIVSEISNDFLTCHICWETYQRPKTLPCGHFFCRECLYNYCCTSSREPSISSMPTGSAVELVSHRVVHCPTCRKAVGGIPLHGSVSDFVNALPDNFYVNSLKDLVAHHYPDRSRSRSDMGDERGQYADGKFLARSKSVSHGTKTVADEGDRSGTMPCLEHPSAAIELYCTEHNKVLCRICHYTSHSLCKECLSIQGAEYRFIRPKVQEILAKLNQNRLQLAAKLRKCIQQRQALSVDAFAIQKHIDDIISALQAKLDAGFAGIKGQLSKVVSEGDRNFREMEEKVKMKDSLLEESVDHLEMISKKGGPLELASALSTFDTEETQELYVFSYSHDGEDKHLEERLVFSVGESVRCLLASEENIIGEISLRNKSEERTERNALKDLGATACDDQKKLADAMEHLGCCDTVDSNANECPSERMTIACRARESEAPVFELRKNLEFTLGIDATIDTSCVLKTGDIACLQSSEKYVVVFRATGSVSDRILLPTVPLGMSPCKDTSRKTSLAVTGFGSKIYFLSVTPKIRLVKSIPTRAQYTGISQVPKRLSLVAIASCEWPPVIDLISLKGMVLKTFGFGDTDVPIFEEPRYIATSPEFLFVPDGKALKILSWNSDRVQIIDGYDSKSYGPTNFRALTLVCGIQGVVLTVDSEEGKLYALWGRDGQWMLTTILEDKFLLGETCSLATGNNATVFVSRGRSVRVYGVECLCNNPESPVRLNLKSPRATSSLGFDQFRTL